MRCEYCPNHYTWTISGNPCVEPVFVARLCESCKESMKQQNIRYAEQHRHELWLELLP